MLTAATSARLGLSGAILAAGMYRPQAQKNGRDNDEDADADARLNAASKKRVVFVHLDLRFGGVEKQLLHVLRGLDVNEFETRLILCEDCGELRAEVPSHVIVHSLGKRLSRASWMHVALRLSRCLKRLCPDVVVSAHADLNVVAVAATRFAGLEVPVVGSFMGIVGHGRMDPFRRPFVSRLSVARCVSGAVAEGVRASYGFSVRTATIPDAVDLPLIDELAMEPVCHDWFEDQLRGPVAVTASRMVRSKRVDIVLRAVAPLARSGQMRLIVLGDGPELRNLETLASELGIAESVSFRGYVTNPYAYFSRCRVFLFGSEREGLGSVLLEAMACRVPIVTTRFQGAVPAMLEPRQTCLSVAAGDYSSMTKAVISLLSDDVLTRRIVRQSRAMVEQDFSTVRLVDAHARLLRSLARRSDAAATRKG